MNAAAEVPLAWRKQTPEIEVNSRLIFLDRFRWDGKNKRLFPLTPRKQFIILEGPNDAVATPTLVRIVVVAMIIKDNSSILVGGVCMCFWKRLPKESSIPFVATGDGDFLLRVMVIVVS